MVCFFRAVASLQQSDARMPECITPPYCPGIFFSKGVSSLSVNDDKCIVNVVVSFLYLYLPLDHLQKYPINH